MLGPKYSRPMCRLERLKWYVYPFLTGRRVWAAPRSSARPDQSQPSRRATGLGAPQTGVVHTKRLWHVCLKGTRVDEPVLPNWANKHPPNPDQRISNWITGPQSAPEMATAGMDMVARGNTGSQHRTGIQYPCGPAWEIHVILCDIGGGQSRGTTSLREGGRLRG